MWLFGGTFLLIPTDDFRETFGRLYQVNGFAMHFCSASNSVGVFYTLYGWQPLRNKPIIMEELNLEIRLKANNILKEFIRHSVLQTGRNSFLLNDSFNLDKVLSNCKTAVILLIWKNTKPKKAHWQLLISCFHLCTMKDHRAQSAQAYSRLDRDLPFFDRLFGFVASSDCTKAPSLFHIDINPSHSAITLACFLLSDFTNVRRFSWFLHSSHGKFPSFELFPCILECMFSHLCFLVCVWRVRFCILDAVPWVNLCN